MKEPSLVNTIIKDRWAMTSLLGTGAFGQVYLSTDSMTGEPVAVKVESPRVKKPVLKLESQVLKRLSAGGSEFVAGFVAVGRFVAPHVDDSNGIYTYLVMTRLGPSISELRKTQPLQKFSKTTTALLGMQMVYAIRDMHQVGVVHRDIKPANFCMKVEGGKFPDLCVIDFGLSRKYVGSDGGLRAERENVGFRGTARYASIQAHFGKELGRVDDLWSLFYMVIEFLTGTLPWKGKEKDKIGDLKVQLTNDDLVANLPPPLSHFLHYLKSLSFTSTPDYEYLSSLFKELLGIDTSMDIHMIPGLGYRYDWQINQNPIATAAEPASSSTLFRKSETLSPVPPLSAPGKMSRPRRFIRQLFK